MFFFGRVLYAFGTLPAVIGLGGNVNSLGRAVETSRALGGFRPLKRRLHVPLFSVGHHNDRLVRVV